MLFSYSSKFPKTVTKFRITTFHKILRVFEKQRNKPLLKILGYAEIEAVGGIVGSQKLAADNGRNHRRERLEDFIAGFGQQALHVQAGFGRVGLLINQVGLVALRVLLEPGLHRVAVV